MIKIEINTKDTNCSMSLEEAKLLHKELNDMFGSNQSYNPFPLTFGDQAKDHYFIPTIFPNKVTCQL